MLASNPGDEEGNMKAKQQLLNTGLTSSHIQVENLGREQTLVKLTSWNTFPLAPQNQTQSQCQEDRNHLCVAMPCPFRVRRGLQTFTFETKKKFPRYKSLKSLCTWLNVIWFTRGESQTLNGWMVWCAVITDDRWQAFGSDVACRWGLEFCHELAAEVIKSRRDFHGGDIVSYADLGWIREQPTIGPPLNHSVFVSPPRIAPEKCCVCVVGLTNAVVCWWETDQVKKRFQRLEGTAEILKVLKTEGLTRDI